MRLLNKFSRELLLWEFVFAVTCAFQFWRGVPEDGIYFLFVIFTLLMVGLKSSYEHKFSHFSKPMVRSTFIWVTLSCLMAVWELISYFYGEFTGRDYQTPTISMLLEPFIAHPWGEFVFIVLWGLLGFSIIKKPRNP